MKMLTMIITLVFMIFVLATSANAGPAVDRARAAMEAMVGHTVTNASGRELLNAWAVTEEPRYSYSEECTPDPNNAEEQICTTVTVAVPYNDEEKAQLWLNKHLSWNLRRLRQYRETNQRELQQGDQDILDARIAATKPTDL